MLIDILRVFIPTGIAFFLGIAMTPFVTHYLYKYKAWKKKGGKGSGMGDKNGTPVFDKLHEKKEVGTPRMGGIVIWGSVVVTALGLWLLAKVFNSEILEALNFLSRNQTWIPLVTLMIGALVGLADDIFEVIGKGTHKAGGLSLAHRLLVVSVMALFVGLWFYTKLDITTLGTPFGFEIFLGWLIVPFFIFVTLCLYASGVIDGIDGLSGGVFAIVFAAYAGIAFYQQQYDLAAFAGTIAGATLAFLWFNIPPARFYMTETGTMGLTVTLSVLAFMTDTLGDGRGVFVLPIIALPLVATVVSDVLQVLSKRYRNRKIFHVAPLHHHFEAIGWPGYKVTMRYWIITFISALIGVSIALV